MRDADDEEKTRLFDANRASKSAAVVKEAPAPPSAAKLGPATAPAGGTTDPDDEATKLINTDSDDEPTKLVEAVGSGEWLLSRGTDPPRSVSRAQLFKEMADGTLSPETYAWKDGMKDWQPLRSIPTLAPLLRGRTAPKVPRAAETSLVKRGPENGTPQSRITAVSRSSATKRAAALVGERASSKTERSQHTVTQSSARASQTAKDSTVLVSGSVPPSDSDASSEPLLPPVESQVEPEPQKRHSSGPPRPAAGQPPSPTELIAKPPVVVTAPRTHREVTQPARSRLTAVTQLTQLAAAAGRQHNLVLWVLGAAGWVVAGVLAGVLLAKRTDQPSAAPAPEPTHASTPEPKVVPPAEQLEPAPPPVVDAAQLPTASSTPAALRPKLPRVPATVWAPPTASAPPPPALVPSGAVPPKPTPTPAATSSDEINSPGF